MFVRVTQYSDINHIGDDMQLPDMINVSFHCRCLALISVNFLDQKELAASEFMSDMSLFLLYTRIIILSLVSGGAVW